MAGYSVVIPTLNEEHWLPQLLLSIEQQRLMPSEVIVVDCGSTDATLAVVKKWQQRWNENGNTAPQLRLLRTKAGIAHQRNIGAKSARENILLFLDADVLLNTKDTVLLLKHFLRTKADIVIPLYRVPATAHRSVDVLFRSLSALIWLAQWGPIPAGGGQCLLAFRSAFNKLNGFDEGLRITEDLDFIRRAGRSNLKVRVAPLWITVSDRRFTPASRWQTIWLYTKVSWWFVFNQHHAQTKQVEYALGEHQH